MPGDTGIDKQLSQAEQTFIKRGLRRPVLGDCETFCATMRWWSLDAGRKAGAVAAQRDGDDHGVKKKAHPFYAEL